jgi:hypothetical protein
MGVTGRDAISKAAIRLPRSSHVAQLVFMIGSHSKTQSEEVDMPLLPSGQPSVLYGMLQRKSPEIKQVECVAVFLTLPTLNYQEVQQSTA